MGHPKEVPMNAHEVNRVLRRNDVCAMTGLTRSVLDREVRNGRFPAPFKLLPDPKARAVGWSLRAIQEWIAEREKAGGA